MPSLPQSRSETILAQRLRLCCPSVLRSRLSTPQPPLALEPLLRKQAKDKEHERKTTCQKSDKSFLPAKDTKKELAKAAHVSHDTIAKGKVILAKASEAETIHFAASDA